MATNSPAPSATARESFRAPPATTFAEAFPNSRKVHLEGPRGIRVPMREITLSGGEPPLRVYDASGPQGHDVKAGLPALRLPWILERDVKREGGRAGGRDESEVLSGFPPSRLPARPRAPATSRQQLHHPAPLRPPRRDHARNGIRGAARGAAGGIRPVRGGPGPRHHPRQHQSSRARADGHRPGFRGEDQRQHRQLGGPLLHRGRGREAALGDPLGRRHRDGPLHREGHPRHPAVDPAQFGGAHRHGADLPGAGEGRRRRRGSDLGDLPGHADRAGRTGGGLLHRPRRGAAPVRPADRPAGDRHRVARRVDPGQVVPGPPPGKLPVYPLPRDLRDHGGVRRVLLAG